MKNKGCLIAVAVLVLVVVLSGLWLAGRYNKMVELRSGENGYEKVWADVQAQYQRRSDLIPNLVATVKGYADFEQKTLTDVVEARAKATQITVDPSQLTPAALEQFQSAQGELSQALGRLMVVAERYPDLKANQNFLELQSQLEGTENRISVARQRFNQAASAYNAYILKFPSNLIAGMFGFDRATLFQADEGAQEAPKVEF
ncbi:MAG TPA: LemA family protein [Candidatus Merdimorpha stercoravium]|uniref:LemA family protein n=1 Tax=Candidatus Merdimorpha stercoravium TaxID=2840863 RepID=A0A9D1HCL7_9FLAO|nr:LemA family protein [Candidatus Merdimorpha stercoravium]